jgi:hypothetical protein
MSYHYIYFFCSTLVYHVVIIVNIPFIYFEYLLPQLLENGFMDEIGPILVLWQNCLSLPKPPIAMLDIPFQIGSNKLLFAYIAKLPKL